jgi:hypothetical protein
LFILLSGPLKENSLSINLELVLKLNSNFCIKGRKMRMYSFSFFSLCFISATLAFASPKQKTPMVNCQNIGSYNVDCHKFPEGYNAPSALHTGKTWSGYAKASFIYWYAQEEGLSLAQSAILQEGSIIMPFNSVALNQDFEFKPGFKLSAGAIYRNEWVLDGTYTWLHLQTKTSATAPENTSSIEGFAIWNVNDWFQQTVAVGPDIDTALSQSLSGPHISSAWDLDVDILDITASRPYYEGSNLQIRPDVGLRSAWISQKMEVFLTQAGASVGGDANLGPQPLKSHNDSHNFGIGPKAGVAADIFLSENWRLQSYCGASILATWFTTLRHREGAQSILIPPGPYALSNDHVFSLLPNAEMKLGFGWHTYANKGKYFFDLSFSYDFMLFWAQNKLRQTLDTFWNGTGEAAGDLTLNGATVTFSFNY